MSCRQAGHGLGENPLGLRVPNRGRPLLPDIHEDPQNMYWIDTIRVPSVPLSAKGLSLRLGCYMPQPFYLIQRIGAPTAIALLAFAVAIT